MKRFLSILITIGIVSPVFSCTFKFKNDGHYPVYIVQEESGEKSTHYIGVGETKQIPGVVFVDSFSVYVQQNPRIFTEEFIVEESHCGQLHEEPALVSYTQLHNAIAQNQPRLTFPHTSQEFVVQRGLGTPRSFPMHRAK